MKQLIVLSGLFLFIFSCTNSKKDIYDKDAIKQEIQALGASVVWALNEANTDTLIRDFWKSDTTLFMIDGVKIKGYNNIKAALEGIPNRRKDLDLTVDEEQVIVLSEETAIHIVEFNEEVTHMNDSISTGQGIWSTIYKKMHDDWKIIMVHESHLKN